MTPQEIFTKVKEHLLKQGVKSQSSNGSCMYRGPRGTQCAVGCLISDAIYCTGMENRTRRGLSRRYSETLPEFFNKENYLLLDKLQTLHDCAIVPDWENGLKQIAEDFNLNY